MYSNNKRTFGGGDFRRMFSNDLTFTYIYITRIYFSVKYTMYMVYFFYFLFLISYFLSNRAKRAARISS